MQESWKHMQCWEAGEGSASPNRRSTGPAVLAGLESMPMRSWILSVKGIRAELMSVELVRSRALSRYGPAEGALGSAAGCGTTGGARSLVQGDGA
jgi:hypothetical protein